MEWILFISSQDDWTKNWVIFTFKKDDAFLSKGIFEGMLHNSYSGTLIYFELMILTYPNICFFAFLNKTWNRFSVELCTIYAFMAVERANRYNAYYTSINNIYHYKFFNGVKILSPFSAGQSLMGILFYCLLHFLRTSAWFGLSGSHKIYL